MTAFQQCCVAVTYPLPSRSVDCRRLVTATTPTPFTVPTRHTRPRPSSAQPPKRAVPTSKLLRNSVVTARGVHNRGCGTILLVDAMNLLYLARGPRRRNPPGEELAKWVEYLAAVVGVPLYKTFVVFDPPATRSSSASKRKQVNASYKARKRNGQRERQGQGRCKAKGHMVTEPSWNNSLHAAITAAGSIALEAPPGYEADDLLAAVADVAERAGASVVVASRDSDMQCLIGERVVWLELAERATPSLPCACRPHRLEDFRAAHGFEPQSYAHYLALVGKPDAGVKSVGIGATAAKKLIQRYGSIQALISAGERRELGSYKRQVAAAFQPNDGSVAARETISRATGAETALSNLAVLKPGLEEGLLLECLAAAGVPVSALTPDDERQCSSDDDEVEAGTAGESGGWGGLGAPWETGLMYPPHAAHLAACGAELSRVSAALSRIGVQHSVSHIWRGDRESDADSWASAGRGAGLLLDVYIPDGWRGAVTSWADRLDASAAAPASRTTEESYEEFLQLCSGPLLGGGRLCIRLLTALDFIVAAPGGERMKAVKQLDGYAKNQLGVLRRAKWVVATVDCTAAEWLPNSPFVAQELLLAKTLLSTVSDPVV